MSANNDLTASLDNLEARLASYRARSGVNSTVVSARVVPSHQSTEEAKSAGPPTDYDAFITPISAANVLPSSHSQPNLSSRKHQQHGEFLAPTPSPPIGAGRLSSRTHSISLSNISRQDDGWASAGEDAPDMTSQATVGGRVPSRAPSSSPTGPLVLAYNSDGGGGGHGVGGQSHRRKASAGGTENMQSWAEVQAAQQAKEQALASARKRRLAREEELLRKDAEERQREEFNSKAYPSSHPSVSPALPSSAAAAYATLSSPLTARSKASQEQQSGYLVPASDSREVLGALASFERRKTEQERTARERSNGGGAPSLPSSARGNGLTPRLPGSSRHSHRNSSRQAFDPNSLDQDDSSAYANSTFVPLSARGSARGLGATSQQKDRRQELLERKERLRQRKQAALEAITKASTPVEQGGTLVVENGTHEQQIEGQPNPNTQQEGSTAASSSSTAPRSRAEERKCEMLDFKGMGEKTCVVQ